MKQKLLNLFFLFTITFSTFAQVANQPSPLEICDDNNDGFASFNLTILDAEVLGSQNSVDFTVTYHLSEDDANNFTNELSSPFNNFINPQTLYVRVTENSSNNFDTTTAILRVLPVPSPAASENLPVLRVCDESNTGDETEVFDLVNMENLETILINGEIGTTVSYFTTIGDAETGANVIVNPTQFVNTVNPQLLYARVEIENTGCFTLRNFQISVSPPPNATAISDFIQCELNSNGNANFDLEAKNAEVLNGQDPAIFAVTYHESIVDAENRTNALSSPYTNISNPQQIYVAITNLDTGCFISTQSFNLQVNEGAEANPDMVPIVLQNCDDNIETDGDISNDSVQFDLSVVNSQILDGQNPSTTIVSYYSSIADAQLGVNPLPNLYTNVVHPQEIFARVDNGSGCVDVTDFTLQVNPLPPVNLSDVSFCEGDSVVLDTGLSTVSFAFQWLLNGNIIPSEDQATLTVNQPGSYSVEVLDFETGCSVITTNSVDFGSPTIVQPTPLESCDDDNDGFTIFDLTTKDNEISGGQTGLLLTYYETQSDAEMGTNAISLTSSYTNVVASTQTIYARLEGGDGSCYATTSLILEAVDCTAINDNVEIDTTTFTVNDLVTEILLGGQCSQVFNITYSTGTDFDPNEPNGIAYFSTTGNNFPFSEGVVLANGDVTAAAGPNSNNGTGSGSDGWPGDVDLENATGIQSFNASTIEFDFVPVVDQISFNFLMASNEYDQGTFECSFSDAFAFLLTDAQGNTTNLAVLPGTTTPILVTNIHPENDSCSAVNEQFFGGYIPLNEPPIGYNGRTIPFTAQAAVNIGESYHIKIVIADDNDPSFDSAVFLQADSFDIGELCNDIGVINVKAFNDNNANGELDMGETDFVNGVFTYEKNNDGVINTVNTSIGNFSIVSTDENDTYSISFNVYDEYSNCYVETTTTFDAVSVQNGDVEIVNFPITEDQTCEDIAVYLVNPLASPRPGFLHENYILLENLSATDVASGTIEFTHDPLLQFNSVNNLNPNYTLTNTANGFTIDFVNLMAGTSEVIEVNLFCPTSVSLGEVVTNSVSYLTDANDVFTDNNTAQLSEIVIGSYDPNDKMESHGPEIVYNDFITSDEYLYYTIRFQNVGTAEAIFIRIEDELDAMLDETTFQMLRSSHDYMVTRTDSSLEWYFDDINLPAEQDDADGSNGYVHFKIKPKSDYSLGDVIPNTASIYFDFNAPIITNTFTTTFVETLSVDDADTLGFVMYPNPAQETLRIQLGSAILDNFKLKIYDIQGKEVITNLRANDNIIELNVSSYKAGIYFVEISDAFNSVTKKLIIN